MTTKTNVKAGSLMTNHNEALTIRSAVKSGALTVNHNESFHH